MNKQEQQTSLLDPQPAPTTPTVNQDAQDADERHHVPYESLPPNRSYPVKVRYKVRGKAEPMEYPAEPPVLPQEPLPRVIAPPDAEQPAETWSATVAFFFSRGK